MAILMRGFELAVDDAERQARSVTMHFLRVPEAGPVTVRATVERQGRSLSTVSGRLEQDGKLVGLALGAYSKPWEGPLLDEPADARGGAARRTPRARPGQRLPGCASGLRSPGRLVMQHRFGEPAFSGAEAGEIGGWLGLKRGPAGGRPRDRGASPTPGSPPRGRG